MAGLVVTLAACNKAAAPPAPDNRAAPHPTRPDGAVSLQQLTPLGPAEVAALLGSEHRFRFPDDDNPEFPRTLAFDGRGRARDGGCDPAACEYGYEIAGNVVTLRRYEGAQLDDATSYRLRLYRSAAGTVYATRGVDGETVAFPW